MLGEFRGDASSGDRSRLLGGRDVRAGARSTRRIWVGRDGREEDFTGRVIINKDPGERRHEDSRAREVLWLKRKGTFWEMRLQRYPWSQAI